MKSFTVFFFLKKKFKKNLIIFTFQNILIR